MEFADDVSLERTRALVIDSNPTSRSMLAAMLREAGVGSVVQTSRVLDARRHLENRSFDVVLCDYHFDSAEYTGQDLLDDLRRAQLLPFSTVFIMVTGEASYAKVAEAAESALDGYLLKPHTAAALSERVHQARQRKIALRFIFEAIESEDFEHAARLCMQRFAARGRYWLYAARIGAELLLRLGQHDAARQLFEAVIEAKAQPWARLGVARAQVDAGQITRARGTLDALMSEQPSYADAYDVMGRVQVEQGELGDALQTYRRAAELTPSSIARLQKQGMLAFFLGETEESIRALERSVSIGIASKMFDPQSLVLLAMGQFDKRDTKGLQRCHDNLVHMLDRDPGDPRLQRLEKVVSVFRMMQARQMPQAVELVKQVAMAWRDEAFDFEAACNVLAMLARVRATQVQLTEDEQWVCAIARRHTISKATTELMAQAASRCPEHEAWIRKEHAEVLALAERSMTHSVKGDPRAAVHALIEQGRRTLNAKLIDMARLVLQRHQARIPEADSLAAAVEALRERFVRGASPGQLGHAGPRQPGGLSVRGLSDAPATPPVQAAPVLAESGQAG